MIIKSIIIISAGILLLFLFSYLLGVFGDWIARKTIIKSGRHINWQKAMKLARNQDGFIIINKSHNFPPGVLWLDKEHLANTGDCLIAAMDYGLYIVDMPCIKDDFFEKEKLSEQVKIIDTEAFID